MGECASGHKITILFTAADYNSKSWGEEMMPLSGTETNNRQLVNAW